MAVSGLSKDALHIYVALAVFLVAALVLRKPLSAPGPWLAVLVVALAGEAVDAFENIRYLGRWLWAASLHDILNTLAWPTILSLFARFRRRSLA